MTHHRILRSLAVAVVLVSVVLLSGCSGDGDDGGPGELQLITADGASEPLWSDGTAPGACPAGVFINANIRFTFSARVDPDSLPGGGFALGSISITNAMSGMPAEGTFAVEDDPAHPAGNKRLVVFRPTLPSNPASTCSAGIEPGQTYDVSLGTGLGPVVVAGGGEITEGASTCFSTCGCPDPGACVATFMDPVPGAPFVLDTTPTTGDPSPLPIDACSIANNTVIIRVNEPLDPNGIDLTNVIIFNLSNGAQVPGTLVFHQAANTTGADIGSQIDYVAAAPFAGGRTYQIVFGPAVKDLAGNPIQTASQLFFQTNVTPSSPQPPLVENFDTSNPVGTSGAAAWTGDGALRATFPTELIGTGADGAFNPAAGVTLLDTDQLVNGVSRQGIWNFTDVTIAQGATVRIIGPYRAHFRCTGTVSHLGIIQAIPGQIAPPTAATPAYDKGAQSGQQQNGLGTDCEANGGVGNAGGGAGGTGSGVTPPLPPPPGFQCQIRALMGENGYGPTLDGVPNGGPGNPLYAGGQGGISGCFPSLSPCTPVLTEIGGLGGAGGTSARLGEPGAPRLGTCLVNINVVQPIAQASPIPVAMIPPIAIQSAGSGGGGGGDHLEAAGTPPANDDQGGGGGGGGGGLRISCVGAYAQGATGQINANGATGGNASNSSGAGGSGSGGQVWIQSFASATFAASSLISVVGPARLFPSAGLIGCSAQASGGGGPGLVQVESPTPTPLNFNLQPAPSPTTGAVYSNPPFAYAGGLVTGQGRSGLRYAGASAPDYTGAVEVFSLGNAPSAAVTIHYQGALEAPNSTPQNPIHDPATIKSMATGGGPITAANLDELDGYAFIEFIVDLAYAAPPVTTPSAILPSVDSITINFSAPSCP